MMVLQRLLAVLALAATAPAVAATGTAGAATGAAGASLTAGASLAASGPAQHAMPMSSKPGQPTKFGIRLMQAPVSERNNPRAQTEIIDSLHPGTTIHRLIAVGNLGAAPVRLRIYAAAAVIRRGQFLPANRQYAQNLMTTWVRVNHPHVLLKPGHSRAVRVTIRVPRHAPEGEQYGVIWAQGSNVMHGHHANVTLVNRAGIRIYLAVGPGGGPPSSFTLGPVSGTVARNGAKVASVEVHNTGGRAVDLTGKLTLTSKSDGLRAGPFAATPTDLAPGQSFRVPVVLPAKVPDGPWQAAITLQSGVLSHSEHTSLAFTATGGGGGGFAAMPVAAVVLILLVLTLAGVLVRRIRRGRTQPVARPATGTHRT
jgi:hypothetical protein